MFGKLFDSNDKQIKTFSPTVEKINQLEKVFESLNQDQIKEKINLLKIEYLKKTSKDLDNVLPEVYALVREASKRTLKLRHYDVQLIAGIVLHQGKIAEQKTGEGKTLTATLPLTLNSLSGEGVHLVTPNDYLSRHGAGWMGPVYDYLGLKVGVIMQERAFVYDSRFESTEFQDDYTKHLREVSRQEAYICDITYGTNHEFGFDYLRDNMVSRLNETVQTSPNNNWGAHNFAIVDEVDSILIDVARTPLIISASAYKATDRYFEIAVLVKNLIKDSDYEVEEKFKNATLTDLGIRRVEKMLGISNLYEQDFETVHLIEQSLSAQTLYEKDRDYVVKDGKIIIVDQFTGRLLPNNRYSQGLHQAIEAKEGVEIQQESQTMAEISYQNYFRMYKKLAGMTGTAETESEEFFKIYKLDVVVIPTYRTMVRKDFNDVVYKTEAAKFKAAADEIVERNKKGQPVLVGTTSVEKSQLLHSLLERRGIKHEILNAKNHEKEALIIAQAGRRGSVTVSTNMAGRGVDIILGGDPPVAKEQEEVISSGGLVVIGTERHESRRIDNQLRGRAGRQGDPGSSKFFVSLQDDLMRVFGGAQVESLMNRFGLDDDVPLEAGIVSKAIENAQKKVEGFNFDRRKQLVDMDDVMNVHREVIYKLRRKVLGGKREDPDFEKWFLDKLSNYEGSNLGEKWKQFEENFGSEMWQEIISQLSLPVIDMIWMEHLVDMDHLREGIGLRGYAQRDPIVEYKKEAHERFEILISRVYSTIAERISHIEIGVGEDIKTEDNLKRKDLTYQRGEFESGVSQEKSQIKIEAVKSGTPKIGRNDLCYCGSGKKYKKCHGKTTL